MAAIYYDVSNEQNIFRSNVKAPQVVEIDFLNNLIETDFKDAMLVLNSVEVSNNEVVQFFMTFDDVVDYFYFGKGVGQISISGSIFSTLDSSCAESMNGIRKFYEAVGAVRGTPVKVSFIQGPVFIGVITGFRTATSAEPMLVMEFNISISITDQTGFEPPKTQVSTC